MLLAALLVFVCVAAAGAYLAARLYRHGSAPVRLAAVHGLAGLGALALLLAGVFTLPHARLVNDAVFLLGIAAIGGIFLFALARDGGVPWPIALLHGLVALIGVCLLAAGLVLV